MNPKSNIRIVFQDEFGNLESGIDENGLFKEFMVEFTNELFNPKYAFFETVVADGKLHFNSRSKVMIDDRHDETFENLGIILAKSILENVFLDVSFNKLFIR